jgi:asparagine synthase (glutamine-hydrolysing)
MCGIAGWLGSLSNGSDYADHMAQALRHRGPDGLGIRIWPYAALVHTRLSIIDLSSNGAQPIGNEDGTVWAVFNGEIYNHRDLRRRLEDRGHIFKGRSDSEVIPHLYEEDGPDFIAKLRGMFAIAVFDTRRNRLILARDRFGIKPVFYTQGADRLGFASEIRALRTLPDIDDRPDRQAVYDFAALFYIPAPETFYTGIRAMRPGELLVAEFGPGGISCRSHMYHTWIIAPDPSMALDQATDRAEALLTAAVDSQLESDVPLGTLLSGGIDSSLVSAAAQKCTDRRIKTFNVRFADKEYDETWAAVATAHHIGSDHMTLDMENGQGTWEHITGLLRQAGQPFADTSLFAAHAVCRLMRQHVTVALSGDGGDEAFGGYNTYWRLAGISRLQALPAVLWSAGGFALAVLEKAGMAGRYRSDRLQEFAEADDTSIVQHLSCWIREQELSRLCVDHAKLLPIRRLFEPQWEYRFSGRAARIERLSAHATETGVRLNLPHDYLFKVDTASMSHSLEVRVPMLDEELFQFGLSLPHRLKVEGQTGKRVLRSLAKRRLPSAVASKPKGGFSIPVDSWATDQFRSQLRETLLKPASRLADFFRPEVYRPIVEAFCDRTACPNVSRQGLYQRIIMLLSVQLSLDA